MEKEVVKIKKNIKKLFFLYFIIPILIIVTLFIYGAIHLDDDKICLDKGGMWNGDKCSLIK